VLGFVLGKRKLPPLENVNICWTQPANLAEAKRHRRQTLFARGLG